MTIDSVFQRLQQSAAAVSPKNAFEYAVCFLNAVLLDFEFILVAENPSDIPGFAPSIRGNLQNSLSLFVVYSSNIIVDLPKAEFLPTNWNNQDDTTTLLYKHKKAPGKIFSFTVSNFTSCTCS
jgi:hypothetical protein